MLGNHKKLKYIYVGIDCHKNTHTAGIINAFNDNLGTVTFENNRKGFTSLINFVSKCLEQLEPEIAPVYGLEDCNHLGHALATFLLNKDCLVKVVNPAYTHDERKRAPIVSKTDEIDSLCLAKVTLDKLDTLPNATQEDLYWTLKQLVKMREAIVKNNVEYKYKLHAQLLHHYPNYSKFFYNYDCKTALALWENYPNPNLLKSAPIDEVVELFTKVSGRIFKLPKVQQILEFVNEHDYSLINYQAERDNLIKSLVKHIRYNNEQLDFMANEIDIVVQKTGYKLNTFIGIEKILGAKIISEIGNIDRFDSADKLARYAGIAPVSFSSGKHDKEVNNKYGNRQLNSYIYNVARVHINEGNANSEKICSPLFLDYYLKKISEGKTKHQAILQVMRRIINIIYGLMKNRSEYIHPQELSNKFQRKHRKRIDKKLQEQQEQKKAKA